MTNSKYEPDEGQIEHWINVNYKQISSKQNQINGGWYEQRNKPYQNGFDTLSLGYASLGRALFFKNCTSIECLEYFKEACRCVIRVFKIVYDPNDEHYDPNNEDFSCVREVAFWRGANYALIAGDFKLAQELAELFRQRPNGKKMDPEVNDYAFGLKYTLLGEDEKALSILKPRLEKYQKKPPKGGYKRNYHTLTTALVGILEKDEALFNEGLAMQLHFYKGVARGEAKNTDEEYFCDHAVALANLGLSRGLAVTVENPRMPQELLIEKA